MEHFHYKIPGWFTYPQLYSYMAKRYDNAHFVEIGSFQGNSAAFMAVEIINSGHNIKLDCIDTWDRITIEGLGTINPEKLPDDIVYQLFLKNIEPVKHIINPKKLSSIEASKLYADESLDFVFIDANHIYRAVMDDIMLWFPKVKKGGHIAGHDYGAIWPGVVEAVNDYFAGYIASGGTVDCGEQCWCVYKA